MKFETHNFGEIEIAEEDVLAFDEGLPGFPDYRRFALLAWDENPICYLQSLEDGDLAFVVVDMMALRPDYDPHVEESHIESLGAYDPENFLVYNICTINEDLIQSTVNLKAPVVINWLEKKGKQVVCGNEEYSVKAPLFDGKNADAASGEGVEIC